MDLMPSNHVPPRSIAPSLRWLGRVGFFAEGVMYGLIGALALVAAFEPGQRPQGSQGTLAELAQAPWGHAMFVALAAGLAMFVLWQLVLAIVDPGHHDDRWRPKRVLLRLGCLFSAAVHAVLVGAAVWRLWGLGGATRSGQAQAYWTALGMQLPVGRWLVATIGICIVVFGVFQFYPMAARGAAKRFRLTRTRLRGVLVALGVLGYVARGVVFVVIGGFLLYAAWRHAAQHATGIAGALAALRRQVYGSWLLGAVAIGLLAYGIMQIASARFGAIRTAPTR